MATGRVPTTANSPLTTKGDLFGYSTAPARLAVGADGEQIVADSSTSTGLRWQGDYAAGKNKIINGDFSVWQRGTIIALTNAVRAYGPDRIAARSFFSAGSSTISQQTFTAGTAPVAGYEGSYFARISCGSTATAWQYDQRIEDVRTFAGQTITYSFWVKASAANSSTTIEIIQNFGSGGSANVTTNATGPSVTTSWQRFSVTVTLPSISGKTIGTGSYLEISVYSNSGVTNSMTVDTWGWQVEAGSVATAFQTATGTIQGELAACQRYYFRTSDTGSFANYGIGYADQTNSLYASVKLPVSMRVKPTSVDYSTLCAHIYNVSATSLSVVTLESGSTSRDWGVVLGSASGLTQYRPYGLNNNNSTSGYIGFSAEL